MQHNILVQLCQHPSFANVHVQLELSYTTMSMYLSYASMSMHNFSNTSMKSIMHMDMHSMSYSGMHSKVHITNNFVYNTVVPVQLCIAHMHYIVKTGVLLHLL